MRAAIFIFLGITVAGAASCSRIKSINDRETATTPAPAAQPVATPSTTPPAAPADTAAGDTGDPFNLRGGPLTETANRDMLAPVFFDYNQSAIRPDAAEVLDAKIRWLRSNPTLRVRIEGHADDRGQDEYNLALGEERASAVVAYLTARGVSSAQFQPVSFGEERLACTDVPAGDECHQRNRRVTFTVLSR